MTEPEHSYSSIKSSIDHLSGESELLTSGNEEAYDSDFENLTSSQDENAISEHDNHEELIPYSTGDDYKRTFSSDELNNEEHTISSTGQLVSSKQGGLEDISQNSPNATNTPTYSSAFDDPDDYSEDFEDNKNSGSEAPPLSNESVAVSDESIAGNTGSNSNSAFGFETSGTKENFPSEYTISQTPMSSEERVTMDSRTNSLDGSKPVALGSEDYEKAEYVKELTVTEYDKSHPLTDSAQSKSSVENESFVEETLADSNGVTEGQTASTFRNESADFGKHPMTEYTLTQSTTDHRSISKHTTVSVNISHSNDKSESISGNRTEVTDDSKSGKFDEVLLTDYTEPQSSTDMTVNKSMTVTSFNENNSYDELSYDSLPKNLADSEYEDQGNETFEEHTLTESNLSGRLTNNQETSKSETTGDNEETSENFALSEYTVTKSLTDGEMLNESITVSSSSESSNPSEELEHISYGNMVYKSNGSKTKSGSPYNTGKGTEHFSDETITGYSLSEHSNLYENNSRKINQNFISGHNSTARPENLNDKSLTHETFSESQDGEDIGKTLTLENSSNDELVRASFQEETLTEDDASLQNSTRFQSTKERHVINSDSSHGGDFFKEETLTEHTASHSSRNKETENELVKENNVNNNIKKKTTSEYNDVNDNFNLHTSREYTLSESGTYNQSFSISLSAESTPTISEGVNFSEKTVSESETSMKVGMVNGKFSNTTASNRNEHDFEEMTLTEKTSSQMYDYASKSITLTNSASKEETKDSIAITSAEYSSANHGTGKNMHENVTAENSKETENFKEEMNLSSYSLKSENYDQVRSKNITVHTSTNRNDTFEENTLTNKSFMEGLTKSTKSPENNSSVTDQLNDAEEKTLSDDYKSQSLTTHSEHKDCTLGSDYDVEEENADLKESVSESTPSHYSTTNDHSLEANVEFIEKVFVNQVSSKNMEDGDTVSEAGSVLSSMSKDGQSGDNGSSRKFVTKLDGDNQSVNLDPKELPSPINSEYDLRLTVMTDVQSTGNVESESTNVKKATLEQESCQGERNADRDNKVDPMVSEVLEETEHDEAKISMPLDIDANSIYERREAIILENANDQNVPRLKLSKEFEKAIIDLIKAELANKEHNLENVRDSHEVYSENQKPVSNKAEGKDLLQESLDENSAEVHSNHQVAHAENILLSQSGSSSAVNSNDRKMSEVVSFHTMTHTKTPCDCEIGRQSGMISSGESASDFNSAQVHSTESVTQRPTHDTTLNTHEIKHIDHPIFKTIGSTKDETESPTYKGSQTELKKSNHMNEQTFEHSAPFLQQKLYKAGPAHSDIFSILVDRIHALESSDDKWSKFSLLSQESSPRKFHTHKRGNTQGNTHKAEVMKLNDRQMFSLKDIAIQRDSKKYNAELNPFHQWKPVDLKSTSTYKSMPARFVNFNPKKSNLKPFETETAVDGDTLEFNRNMSSSPTVEVPERNLLPQENAAASETCEDHHLSNLTILLHNEVKFQSLAKDIDMLLDDISNLKAMK